MAWVAGPHRCLRDACRPARPYALIRGRFDCEYRGKVFANGKGQIDMYFIVP